jgi:hypothetical protein
MVTLTVPIITMPVPETTLALWNISTATVRTAAP